MVTGTVMPIYEILRFLRLSYHDQSCWDTKIYRQTIVHVYDMLCRETAINSLSDCRQSETTYILFEFHGNGNAHLLHI